MARDGTKSVKCVPFSVKMKENGLLALKNKRFRPVRPAKAMLDFFKGFGWGASSVAGVAGQS